MQAIVVNLAYKLAISLAGFIYKKFIENKADDQRHEQDKQKDALIKAIKKADTDEEYANLSVLLSKLNSSKL